MYVCKPQRSCACDTQMICTRDLAKEEEGGATTDLLHRLLTLVGGEGLMDTLYKYNYIRKFITESFCCVGPLSVCYPIHDLLLTTSSLDMC